MVMDIKAVKYGIGTVFLYWEQNTQDKHYGN